MEKGNKKAYFKWKAEAEKLLNEIDALENSFGSKIADSKEYKKLVEQYKLAVSIRDRVLKQYIESFT